MTDAQFLRIFAERIQPVVGWPEWKVTGAACPKQVVKVGNKWMSEWASAEMGNRWGGRYDDHEAAELCRGWLRRWLRKHRVNITYWQGDGVGWAIQPVNWHEEGQHGSADDENSALIAAFDAVREAEK